MPSRKSRYKVQKQLGDGTYGSVWKAINRQTNEVVSPVPLEVPFTAPSAPAAVTRQRLTARYTHCTLKERLAE